MRKEFLEKDNILITYTEKDVCFEDSRTAESILLGNDGAIIHSNFDEEKNEYIEVVNTRPITQNIEHPVILHYINKPKPFEIDARYKDKYSHIYKEYYDYVCKKLEEYKRDMD